MSGYQNQPPEMTPAGGPANVAPGPQPGMAPMPMQGGGMHRYRDAETKPAYKTTELIAYVAAVLGVLIASAVVDEAGNAGGGFDARDAWFYVTLLTVGYLISRGLAKSGNRHRGEH